MNIAQVLEYLFPDANPLLDYIVQDDGEGQFIAQWNLPDTQPTQAELEAAWDATQIALGKAEIKRQLLDTDVEFIRVIEDLIDVNFDVEQLPQSAKDKINNRKALRAQL